MVKPGACVIDVGINRIVDEETGKTKLVGDVEFKGNCLLWPQYSPKFKSI